MGSEDHEQRIYEDDPKALKRFRDHPDVKKAKERCRERLKDFMPPDEAYRKYDEEVKKVREREGLT